MAGVFGKLGSLAESTATVNARPAPGPRPTAHFATDVRPARETGASARHPQCHGASTNVGATQHTLPGPLCGLGCGLVPTLHLGVDRHSFGLKWSCALQRQLQQHRDQGGFQLFLFPCSWGLGCGLVPFPFLLSWERTNFAPGISGSHFDLTILPGLLHIPGPQMAAATKNSDCVSSICVITIAIASVVTGPRGHTRLSGSRVGEADNPGPEDQVDITLAVINPTAVLNKADIISETGAHVVLASETSATAGTQ